MKNNRFLLPILIITFLATGLLGYEYWKASSELATVDAELRALKVDCADGGGGGGGGTPEDSAHLDGTITVVVYDLANYDNKVPKAEVVIYTLNADGSYDASAPLERGTTNEEGAYSPVKTDFVGKFLTKASFTDKTGKVCTENHVRTENKTPIHLIEIPIDMGLCK